MNNKDLLLIRELDNNCRQSYSKIAKKLKLSREAISIKVKNLFENQIILKFRISLNIQKLGYMQCYIILKYQETTPDDEKEIVKYLMNNDKVRIIVKYEDGYDLYFSIYGKNQIEIHEEIIKLKTLFEEKIIIEEVLQPIDAKYYGRKHIKFLNNSEFKNKNTCNEIITLSDNEWKIINILKNNPRASIIEIQNKTKMSHHKIKKHLENFEKNNIITAYGISIDLEKLGYDTHKILLSLTDIKKLNCLESFARAHPNINYFAKFIGKYDVALTIECKDKEEFTKIFNDIKKTVDYKIKNINFCVEKRTIKYLF